MDVTMEQVYELVEHLDQRPPDDRPPGLLTGHLLQVHGRAASNRIPFSRQHTLQP